LPAERTNSNVLNEIALLVHVTLPGDKIPQAESLEELESLAEAAGAIVAGYCSQRLYKINPACYVGSGKAQEIAQRAAEYNANVIIFDNDLSPAQIRELEKIINLKVIDRSELILDIFASRARTSEARLQVELAQLQYTYPRLTRMWTHLDTVVGAAGGTAGAVGGLGTRGPGEKQLEIDRRLVQKRLTFLKNKSNEIDKRKHRQVRSRHQHYTICLVGYTNAGKSSLMNALTGIKTLSENKLFSTLDTKTTSWNLTQGMTALLSDTVGFVRDLPHHLIASFRATLEEAIHADLLLHVLDVSHTQAEAQMESVNRVIQEMGCESSDNILLLNKIDRREAKERLDTLKTLYPDSIAISAKNGMGLEVLVDRVIHKIRGEKLHLEVTFPPSNGLISNFLRAKGEIVTETYTDSQVVLEAVLGKRQLPELQRLRPDSCRIISPEPASDIPG